MKLNRQSIMPAYVDGGLTLYDLVDVTEQDAPDFPVRKIMKRKIGMIGFRALAVFDRTRLEFEQAHKEIQMKIAIPQWNGINTDCVVVIDGKQYKIYNCAHVVSKQGYPETELTLITPEMAYRVFDADDYDYEPEVAYLTMPPEGARLVLPRPGYNLTVPIQGGES